jgi:hypothetical protein
METAAVVDTAPMERVADVSFSRELPKSLGSVGKVNAVQGCERKAQLLRLAVSLGNFSGFALVDSGATGDFISQSAAEACSLHLTQVDDHPGVEVADGAVVEVRQCVTGKLKMQKFSINMVLDVVKGLSHDIILGQTFLQNVNPTIDWKSRVLSFYKPGKGDVNIMGCDHEQDNSPVISLISAKEADKMCKKGVKFQAAYVKFNHSNACKSSQPHTVYLMSNAEFKEKACEGWTVSEDVHTQGLKWDPKLPGKLDRIQHAGIRKVIEDHADRFPEDLPGIPPSRGDLDISIETEQGAKPHARNIGKYSPLELEEMKKQIDYLLSKGMIQPSQSPYGAAILFAPKKDNSL